MLLSNGRRTTARRTLQDRDSWRRPLNDEDRAWTNPDNILTPVRWMWGVVNIRDDEVSFVDAPGKPEPDFSEGPTELLIDLYEDEALRTLASTVGGIEVLISLFGESSFLSRDC